MLIDEGANKYALNKHGLNCLHVAAQGDQPSTLYYFAQIHRLDIRSTDFKKSTSLHWAIFSESELVVCYILARLQMNDLDCQDSEGNSYMHLAIKSVEELGSARPVRMLLFNGAPTNLVDNENKKPIDYAQEITNPKLRLEILRTLDQQKTTLKQWLQYETQLKK